MSIPSFTLNHSFSQSNRELDNGHYMTHNPDDPSSFDLMLENNFEPFLPCPGYLTTQHNTSPSQRPGPEIYLNTDVGNYPQYASGISPSDTLHASQGGSSPSPLSSQLHTPNGLQSPIGYHPSSGTSSPGGGTYVYTSSVHERALVAPAGEPIIISHPEQDQLLLFSNNTKASSLSNTAKYTFKQQAQLWREALHVLNRLPCVPQAMYKPHTDADRRRYVEEVHLEAPIKFNCLHPDELGIPLTEAINGRFRRLDHKDDTVFEGRGPSVSIRIEWPGYRGWSRQIPTKDFRSPPGPITRAKLAKNVAKCVKRFIEDNQKKSQEEDADPTWRVGPGHIRLEDLILDGLHHVSMGSWQPFIRLNRSVNSRPLSGAQAHPMLVAHAP